MALQNVIGFPFMIGPGAHGPSAPATGNIALDAANEASIFFGHIITSDGGSHTIDTTGSSSIGWNTETVTFANASTTVKVGLAAVDTDNGPPMRAVNVADVITFDVSKSMVGGSGLITSNAWLTHVPDAGTKTIANGDLVVFAVQMTARAGADAVQVGHAAPSNASINRPTTTSFVGGSYTTVVGIPKPFITFSDGAFGWIAASDVYSLNATRTWNSSGGTKEYGNLYQFPFPMKINGLWGWVDPDADFDVVLYSDPLGTPVAERTVSFDSSTVAGATMRRFFAEFASPYTTTANQKIGAVWKPGASNISTPYVTLGHADHKVARAGGTACSGISRASGAFGEVVEQYYIGLLVSAFDDAVSAASGISRARAASGF